MNHSLQETFVQTANTCAVRESTSQRHARELMGEAFFGPGDGLVHFGFVASDTDAAILNQVPFSDELLLACKDTHILVADLGCSVIEICRAVDQPQELVRESHWYERQKYAHASGEVRWWLIHKEATREIYNDLEVPSERAMLYAILAYYKKTGERILRDSIARCTDGACGFRAIGEFNEMGLSITDDPLKKDYEGLPYCVAQKPV